MLIQKLSEAYYNEIIFSIDDDLNFEKYFEVISKHNKLYQEVQKINLELDNYSSLYTVVQKSILNKYKEKTPPSLNNLDFLLSNIHNSVLDLTTELDELNTQYKLSFKDVIIWTEGMLLMLKLRSKMNEGQFTIIRDVFPLDNLENLSENSWVDITLANMTNFFKYYFSKSTDLTEIKETVDFEKWKKYFQSLIQKVIKKEGF